MFFTSPPPEQFPKRMAHFKTLASFTVLAAIVIAVSCSEDPVTPGDENGKDSIPVIVPGDTAAPSTITDGSLRFALVGSDIVFEWSAPHDDTPTDKVDRYEIRFSYTEGYYPPRFWDLSTPVSNPPAPAEPGSLQSYRFSGSERAKDLYVGIRSYDAAGNRSEPSNLAVIHVPGLRFTGRCIDGLTGAPVEGLDVRVGGGAYFDLTTDADGVFEKDEISPGPVNVEIVKGSAAMGYHRVKQLFILDNDTTHTFVAIPYIPMVAPVLDGLPLLRFFKQLTQTDIQPLFAKWRRYPIPCYIPDFTNSEGLDFGQQARAAVARWIERGGYQIFSLVDSPPDTGIVVVYREHEDIAPLIGFTRYLLDDKQYPYAAEVHVAKNFLDAVFLYKVMLHEFGHTIRFGHLDFPNFIMYGGQPLPADITDDEITALILHRNLPSQVWMSIYDESAP